VGSRDERWHGAGRGRVDDTTVLIVAIGIIIELRYVGRTAISAAHEVGTGGPRQVQEPKPDLQRPRFAGLDPAGDVAQAQIEFQGEIIVSRQGDVEWAIEVTIRVG